MEHINLYQQECSSPTDAIAEHAEDIDLEYLSEDLPKIFESMRKATYRIQSISNSLRTFSRGDTQCKVNMELSF